MKPNNSRKTPWLLSVGLVLSVASNGVQSGATSLATEPFTSTSKLNALPNIMFALDDSGSMDLDYLPDWAGPWKNISGNVVTPDHRFFNGAYNGVAYNPETRYRPPVMYSSTGALDTSTYPSMDGKSPSNGGDGTASAASPNWRAVKKDGYGVQSNATVNIEGNAYYYRTVAGEYCTTAQLRSCTAASAPSGSYPFPAKLRWCTTSLKALDTTANSNNYCQASNIADTPTNTANGVTAYTFPRIAGMRTSTLTVNSGATVSGISVDGAGIMSAAATGGDATSVAAAIVTQINACTYGLPTTTNCGTVGYRATSAGSVVTIIAPAATTATPVVSGGSTTVSGPFSGNNVPGQTVLTVITPTVTSYPKGTNRTDCAGSDCTYAEEMTNYANWHAYYRTRMQMMKTSASIAFSSVDDKFRVGYYTINNGSNATTGGDFLNVSAFSGTQKHAWYSMFFLAKPFGPTPLRTGLSNAGRMYAGKLGSLNGQDVVDPMQYSCQQNFTILSTDGYWNDASDPVQVDGTSAIGQQDGSDPRPYYDGATYTRTVSQTTRSDLQVGVNQKLVESRTQQQQEVRSRLDQSVVTTTVFPYKLETTPLQTRTTPLIKSEYRLQSRTYPLMAETRVLQENTFQIQSTTRPLERYTYNLTETTTPLREVITRITKTVYPLQTGTETVKQTLYKLQKGTETISKVVSPLQKRTQTVNSTTYPLQEKRTLITIKTYQLQKKTYKLKSSTRQLQKSMEVSLDGGDTWQPTGWVNVSSCTVSANGPGYTRNTQCRYDTAVEAGGLDSCTTVAASAGPTNYTVGQAVTCSYETTPTLTQDVASCDKVNQGSSSPYSPYVTCTYASTVASTQTGQNTCVAKDQSGAASMTGNKVECGYDGTSTTSPVGSCTKTATNTGAAPKVECIYSGTGSNVTGLSTCTPKDQTGQATMTGDKVVCAYDTASAWTAAASCSPVDPGAAATATRTSCQYGTAGAATVVGSCTPNDQTGQATMTGDKVACSYNTVSWANSANCTPVTPSPAYSQNRITCRYNPTAESPQTVSSCTNYSQSTSGAMTGDKVVCDYNTKTWANSPTCNPVTPSPAYSASRITCRYGSPGSPQVGQTTCTANNQSTSGSMTGDKVVCAWDTAAYSTSEKTSCTWNVPAAVNTPKTECVYSGATVTATNLTSCTAVPPTGSGTASNGTVWTGPSKSCAYMAATVATNLPNCSPTGSPGGPINYSNYSTCGYGNAVNSYNLNSCVVDPPEAGPSYTQGSTTACAYQSWASTINTTSCNPVAQSPTFSATQKTCSYAAATTSTETSCTETPMSVSAPYSGPAVHCYYSATTSASSNNATNCNANRQTGSPYTGPAVDCTYSATPVNSTVTTCTTTPQSLGPAFSGPAVSCAYGAQTSWSPVNSGSCTAMAQSAGPTYSGPARECAYNGVMVETLTDNSCTEVLPSSGPVYDVLQTKHCVPGEFPVVGAPVLSVVDTCSEAPTSVTDPVTGKKTETATTCTYRAPVTQDVGACTVVPASGSSPYVTSVSCPVTDTGWVGVEPSCTAVATPTTFDSFGKRVECRTTDLTAYTADNPSGPVPVPSCTSSTDPVSKVQTICTEMLKTGPTPVQSCVPADPGAPPSYVKVTCNTTNTSASSMGCVALEPSAPLWQTVTCNYNEGSGTVNTLADVAAYYYKTDLRNSGLNNCVGAIVSPATAGSDVCANNVPTSTTDTNTAQHMTTFTLGLGASGYMQYSKSYATDATGDFPTVKGVSPYAPENGIAANPSGGVCSWQASGNCNWPYPSSNEQTTIDDLWHAGVNGRGAYFSATDPVSLANSISSALSGVAAAGGAAAAPALSSPTLTPTDSYVFLSTFTTYDWTGELVRRQIEPFSGALLPGNDWAVQAKLDAKSASVRNIYVFDSSFASTKLRPFTTANFGTNAYFNVPHISTAPVGLTQFLCASTDTCLSAGDQDSSHASGANLVEYLRGDRTNEGTETDNTKYYRARQHVLGDMVNAQVVYVTKPKFEYSDPGYTAFVTAKSARQAVVYAGANDGMLHAFAAKGSATTEALVDAAALASARSYVDPTNASLLQQANDAQAAASAAVATDTVVGQELWAIIPATVLPNLYKLADKDYKDKHRPFVDATPVVGDVCISDCSSAASAVWKTILVGGLGRGGRGYYALDVTDPASPKGLWEYTEANLGYTYGNPQIVKLASGQWVVMFASGYNNIANDDGGAGDGVGRLYVLDAYTGLPVSGVSPISTGVGTTSSPSGLTKITAQVLNPTSDNTVEAVYGGDLLGNLWRFDVNNTIGASGYDAQLLATLKDGAGNVQPVTTKPEVGLIENYKVVFVGTGRYLDASDANDTSTQSVYAIKDPRTPLTNASTPIFDNPGGSPRVVGTSSENFVRQIYTEEDCPAGNTNCTAGEKVRLSTNNAVSFASNNGWFVDLITESERANTDPVLGLGMLAFSTNVPSLVACDVGGKSYGYFLNYLTGGPIDSPGNVDTTTGKGYVGVMLANQLASSVSLAITKSGKVVMFYGLSGGDPGSRPTPQSPQASITRRTSWRELIRN